MCLGACFHSFRALAGHQHRVKWVSEQKPITELCLPTHDEKARHNFVGALERRFPAMGPRAVRDSGCGPGTETIAYKTAFQPERLSMTKQVTNHWQVVNNGEPFWTGYADEPRDLHYTVTFSGRAR